MRVAVLFSGGKDSTYALYKILSEGYDVRYLVTMLPARSDSWMFHHPCIELTKLQAEAIGIKHIMQTTTGEKEKELNDLIDAVKPIVDEVDGLVSGAILSRYQKDRIDAICKELGLKSITPLWHKNEEKLLKEEIETGFKIIITAVAAAGFDEKWLGRELDEKTISELKKLQEERGINISGDGGEFETLVLDGPIFKKRLKLLDTEIIWEENSGYLMVKNAKVVDKT